MNWVWTHSRSRHGTRLVLLAIADCASGDGGDAWPSIAELRRKSGLGERAVQVAIAELVTLGELRVDYNAGPRGCNRYRVIMGGTPAESAPPQNLHPAESAPPHFLRGSESAQANGHTPAESAHPAESAPPQISTPTPAESAPGTVKEPSVKNSPSESSIRRKRATRIPDDFTVTPAMAEWARENVPGLIRDGRAKRETDKFVNYWRSKSGSGATKLDWTATWRNWMLTADERADPRIRGTPPAATSTTDQRVAQAQALKATLASRTREAP